MLNNHLSEEEVQQYVMDKEAVESGTLSHVQHCESCRARVETWQLLFTALEEQPAPAFDFNLSELVMAKLPSPTSSASRDNTFVYLALAIIIPLGVLFYLFRKDLLILLPDSTALIGYLVIPLVVTVLVLLCIDMYKNYQQKMNALDFN